MSPTAILLLIVCYFGLLILISYFTGKEDSNAAFLKLINLHHGIWWPLE